MGEKQKTSADIIAEMRCGLDKSWHEIDREWVRDLPDRLEAALKREKAEIEADALAAGGIVEAERHKPGKAAATTEESSAVGNMTAMREALALAIEVGDWCCANTDDPLECCEFSCAYQVEPHGEAGADCPWKKIRAALSAPPRNCDRLPNSAAAIEAYREETGLNTHPVQLWLAPQIYAFIDWLLAQATERKGDNDGSK